MGEKWRRWWPHTWIACQVLPDHVLSLFSPSNSLTLFLSLSRTSLLQFLTLSLFIFFFLLSSSMFPGHESIACHTCHKHTLHIFSSSSASFLSLSFSLSQTISLSLSLSNYLFLLTLISDTLSFIDHENEEREREKEKERKKEKERERKKEREREKERERGFTEGKKNSFRDINFLTDFLKTRDTWTIKSCDTVSQILILCPKNQSKSFDFSLSLSLLVSLSFPFFILILSSKWHLTPKRGLIKDNRNIIDQLENLPIKFDWIWTQDWLIIVNFLSSFFFSPSPSSLPLLPLSLFTPSSPPLSWKAIQIVGVDTSVKGRTDREWNQLSKIRGNWWQS